MSTPYFSIGTISQKLWRGVGTGPLDDCWLCADAQCVHGVAPWLPLSGAKAYRAAAGVPDSATGAEGGSLEASLKAIKALYPSIAPMVELYRGPFAGLDAKLMAGHPISASVRATALTGVLVNHRIALRSKDGAREYINALWPAYTLPKSVSPATLKSWFLAYPGATEANALIFPTVEEAFTTHPLYVPPISPTPLGPGLYEVKA